MAAQVTFSQLCSLYQRYLNFDNIHPQLAQDLILQPSCSTAGGASRIIWRVRSIMLWSGCNWTTCSVESKWRKRWRKASWWVGRLNWKRNVWNWRRILVCVSNWLMVDAWGHFCMCTCIKGESEWSNVRGLR